MACHNILAPGFGADDASVGIHNDIWFWGNVPGSVLEAEAVISELIENVLFSTFLFAVALQKLLVGNERLIVSRSKFMDAVP